ncbi:aryl-sulfate sulfotransferase [Abyssalbus ytuae]|uniref:Aryl-sulfate sulfotransferase n=1 Tax=Abyssalbus ytuae TaxID=2926907 RepID=A0A9E7D1V6_9FLAO|nr:aryl-sulfate sulfotransferase [Abyssalbus ytuae]UOB16044.1 aryl-sulfate sulfotransferase [Abyssalbus ytuae]
MKHVLFALILFIIVSCNRNYKPNIGLIKIKSVENNALKIKMTVETSDQTDAYIRYWKFLNKDRTDSIVLYSPISKNNSLHQLMIVDLNLNTTYYYNIVAKKNNHIKVSKTYNFKTSSAIPWVPYFRKKDSIANVKFDGYIHFHSRQVPGYMFLINGESKLAAYQKNEDNFKVSKWTHKETLLGILSNDTLNFTNGRKIIEYDKFGNVLFEVETGKNGMDKSFHHEVDLDENGNILTLVYNEKEVDLSKVGGVKKDTVKGDGILVLNHKGEKIWEWSVFDVANPLDDKNILNTKKDWLHANSLFKDKYGNYIISFRNTSQIWKINGETGELIWKLGGIDSDFEIPDEAVFAGQHNIRFNKKDELVLLDNGNLNFKPGYKKETVKTTFFDRNEAMNRSRLLTLSIDTINMKVNLIKAVNFPEKYYTHSQGSAEYINDNLIVFCSTNTKRIVYTNNKGDVLGIVPLEYSTYRAQYVEKLYDTSYAN